MHIGVEPPPLEEFKRLMESLEDQDSIFEDDDDMFEDTDSSNVFSGVDEDGQKWYVICDWSCLEGYLSMPWCHGYHIEWCTGDPCLLLLFPTISLLSNITIILIITIP